MANIENLSIYLFYNLFKNLLLKKGNIVAFYDAFIEKYDIENYSIYL